MIIKRVVAMPTLNPSFSHLDGEYIFAIIDRKLIELKKKLQSVDLINLSIGDIALPLAPSIATAITKATQEMSTPQGLKGYPPTYGYDFLQDAIVSREFSGLNIDSKEIYISDGTNSDVVNIQELFSPSAVIAFTNPTYPAYFNASVINGRTNAIFLPCLPENNFTPQPPQQHCDVIYLCSPNNPTGTALTKKALEGWVSYAHAHEAIIILDSAYASFASSPDVPKSIYEIPGAHTCAVECRSFSKSAGFTGLRCAYTVIPKTVIGKIGHTQIPLHKLWEKRLDIKFNGVAYPIQRGAEAALSADGRRETAAQVAVYLSLAKQLKEGLTRLGQACWGGTDSPYIWWKTPSGKTSLEFFDQLLGSCHLISVPGTGFGSAGEGYVRLSAFSSLEKIDLALNRIRNMMG